MTYDEIAAAWTTPGNNMTSAEAQSLTSAFSSQVNARRRRSSIGLAIVAVAFAAIAALSAAAMVTQDDLHTGHAWMFASINAVIWCGWIVALKKHRSGNRPTKTGNETVHDVLQSALKGRLSHSTHLKIIAIGMVLSFPLVAWSLHLIVEVGRLAPDDVPLRIAFGLGAYTVAFACLASDYFGRTAREIDDLRSLLASYDQDGPSKAEERI